MLRSRLLSCLLLLAIFLTSCTTALSSVQSYLDTKDGYQFLYPSGWIQVGVESSSKGVDVVFHDLVERSENVSVVINPIPNIKSIKDLGTPSEVGYRFLQQLNNDPQVQREADLINAQGYDLKGKTYYNLEYEVKLPDGTTRHELANVTVNRQKLYTFNLSTPQNRWSTIKPLFEKILPSFQVF